MNCLNPSYIKSPETRLLRQCLLKGRSFEYYYSHANARRNLVLDPVPLINEPSEYYDMQSMPERVQKVPCGKCTNCLKRKVNDYFVRNYYEWIESRALGGCTFFVTLTYADDCLPRVEVDGISIPCFDSQDVNLFLKRLRKYLDSYGYTSDFHYFIVEEYGGELGRPHLHGLMHMYGIQPTARNLYRFKELLAKAWTKVSDRRNWYANEEQTLFNMQRVDSQLLNDLSGVRYVCKYVGKQIGAEEFDKLDIDKRFKRSHYQSVGLGSCLTKYVDADEFKNGLVTIDGFKYALPNYFLIKLRREFYCYNDDGSIIYCPTSFARDSAKEFTLSRLEEYKALSVLNEGFPSCPASLYDPDNLALLTHYMENYGGYELRHDFSSLDPVRFPELARIIEDVNLFFDAVDMWYKPKYEGQAKLYEKHQKERFDKKIGLK